jgi:hypothetical protein
MGGGGKVKSYDVEKACPSINHLILSGMGEGMVDRGDRRKITRKEEKREGRRW